MAKRNILKIDVPLISFTLIGISSHENDYRLCWNLNEYLDMELAQADNIVTDSQEFSCFAYEGDIHTILLISNRCDNGFLLDKYKNIDFILKFDPELTADELSTWQYNLKKSAFGIYGFSDTTQQKYTTTVGIISFHSLVLSNVLLD